MITVIIPAANEAGWIGRCLTALLASDPVVAEIIVVPNGCKDTTAEIARSFAGQAEARGWGFRVVELAKGSKTAAMNAGDAEARFSMRIYCDADVTVSPAVLPQIAEALAGDQPRFAAATPVISQASSPVTRAYARIWQRLPFAQAKAGGYGLFGVNAAGRARWRTWPPIISDDTFARLQFAPAERVQVPATYLWPMVEGFLPLVSVRRRQDAGVAEIKRNWPALMKREGKERLAPTTLTALALRDPWGLFIYFIVWLLIRRPSDNQGFTRGR